jgi:hypothetical protein
VTGEVIGVYLFRRGDTRVNRSAPTNTSSKVSIAASRPAAPALSAAQRPSPSKPTPGANLPSVKQPRPSTLDVRARVKVTAADDDRFGQIGTVQSHLDDDGDGLTIGVVFRGDEYVYAYKPDELKVVTDHDK